MVIRAACFRPGEEGRSLLAVILQAVSQFPCAFVRYNVSEFFWLMVKSRWLGCISVRYDLLDTYLVPLTIVISDDSEGGPSRGRIGQVPVCPKRYRGELRFVSRVTPALRTGSRMLSARAFNPSLVDANARPTR